MTRQAALAAAAIAALALTAAPAWAHPFIDATAPARLSSAPVGTASVTVWYSEGVELAFSSLKVYDSGGDQVDNGDTAYHEGDTSLRVTVPPLGDGVYTVASSVLSRVDGHLVGGAFIFAVGSATIDAAAAESVAPTAQVFLPEAAARLPGLLGQSLVIGAAAAFLLAAPTWRPLGLLQAAGDLHRSRFMALVGAGAVMVLASNVLMLAAQSWRLEASVLDALGTTFGGTVALRMAITVALLAAWFAAERSGRLTARWAAAFAALGLALAATMTMVGHGAASGVDGAAILDYAHNVIAGIWIGGVVYLLIAALPSILRLGDARSGAAILAAIPTFSAAFVLCVGVAAITGPLLMWVLEDSTASIAGSTYGAILAAKVAIGSAMVALAAWRRYPYGLHAAPGAKRAIARLKRSLRAEAILGVALLAAVALLTNTTLPGGEAGGEASAPALTGLRATEFSAGAAFDVTVWPLAAGANEIAVSVTAPDGTPLDDLEGVRVKVSSPQRAISPIEVDVRGEGATRSGELTLGFWGPWRLDVEALRSGAANESVALEAFAKPLPSELSVEITEHEMPDGAVPLHMAHHGGTAWISDPSAPRVWSLDAQTGEVAEHAFEGVGSLTVSVARDGTVWFADSQSAQIGSLDAQSREASMTAIPASLGPRGLAAMPAWIHAASDGDVWVSVPNWNMVLEHDPREGSFVPHVSPTPQSRPFGLAEGPDGAIWFAQLTGGKVGRIDALTGGISEFAPDPPLRTAETLAFGPLGGLWVSEHAEAGGVARLETALGTFSRASAPDAAALPNSVSFDRHRNAWFAQHTVDALAVLDPASGELVEVPLPTARSQAQFTAADGEGRIWYAAPGAARVGHASISAPASAAAREAPTAGADVPYSLLAAPVFVAAAVGAPLLAARALSLRRRALGAWRAGRIRIVGPRA